MQNIFITGSNGFVGRALSDFLEGEGFNVRRGVRASNDSRLVSYGNLREFPRWHKFLNRVDCVVHSAALVHQMSGQSSADDWLNYEQLNINATRFLAEQAVLSGVKRFIFISTIKVNGEYTSLDAPFTNKDLPCPQDFYAKSKFIAENELKIISKKYGLELVIIRPPLIYGPGVKGNLNALIRLISMGVPIPLGGINNKRSFIGIKNLSSLISKCITSSSAPGNIYLASDGADLSTPELIRIMGHALDKKVRLINVPLKYLEWVSGVAGEKEALHKLTNSLRIDIEHTCNNLSWTPMVHPLEGITESLNEAS